MVPFSAARSQPRSCSGEFIFAISAPATVEEVKFGAERNINQPPLEKGWSHSKLPSCPNSTRVLVSMRKSGHSHVVSPHSGLYFPTGKLFGFARGVILLKSSTATSSNRRQS